MNTYSHSFLIYKHSVLTNYINSNFLKKFKYINFQLIFYFKIKICKILFVNYILSFKKLILNNPFGKY